MYHQTTAEKVQFFQACVQRRLYVSYEAARVARAHATEEPPVSPPETTCGLEGTFRPARSRERRSLCYRSLLGFQAMWGLLLLYHNMVGSGKGCLYTLLGVVLPTFRWNPFAQFPARWKPIQTKNTAWGTPFRKVTTHYRQQHSWLLQPPLELEPSLIPNELTPLELEVVLIG